MIKLGNYVDDLSTFTSASFLKFVAANIGAEYNKPYVIQYLQSLGFKDVTVERRTNEHNGRQNVWLIKAVKA